MKSTKHLALELGLLRKRSSTSRQNMKYKKNCQIYAYLIVIDFESTCWKDSRNKNQEIIEFPAVLLNTSTGEIESEFHYYVQPHENPILSSFCTELTGITQEQVEAGIPLSVCLRKFSHWLKKISEERKFGCNNVEDKVQKKCTFVTWSDWDLGVCLKYETQRKQLKRPQELNSWIDLRATYRKFYDRRPNGLNGALQDLGITFEGREHSGIIDSRNTAILAYRMIRDGCIMTITKSIAGRVSGACIGQNFMLRSVNPPTLKSSSPTTIAESEMVNLTENTDPVRNISANEQNIIHKVSRDIYLKSSEVNAEIQNHPKSLKITHSYEVGKNKLQDIAAVCDRNFKFTNGLRSNNCNSKMTIINENGKRCKKINAVVQAVNINIVKNTSCHIETKTPCVEDKVSTDGNDEHSSVSTVEDMQSNKYIQDVPSSSSSESPWMRMIIKKKASHSIIEKNSIVQTNVCDANFIHLMEPLSETSNLIQQFKTPSPVHYTLAEKNKTPHPVQNSYTTRYKQPIPVNKNFKSPLAVQISTINEFKTPSPIQNNIAYPGHKTVSQNSSNMSFLPVKITKLGNSENNFKTPGTIQTTEKEKSCSFLQSNDFSNNSLSSRSDLPNTSPSPRESSSFNHGFMNESMTKRTPPMCECGRRTCRKIVQSPGPNAGRAFYCCPVGRKCSTNKKSGCGFFKWEPSCNESSFINTSHSYLNNRTSSVSSNRCFSSIMISPPYYRNNASSFLSQPNFSTPSSNKKDNCMNPSKSAVNVWETEMNNVNLSDFDTSF